MSLVEVAERYDRWSLMVPGAEIARACFDWAVTLTLSSGPGGGTCDIRIGNACVLIAADAAEVRLYPEGNPAGLAPLLRLVRLGVSRIDAFKDGHLEIGINDGTVLSVPASDDFEPWEISGSKGPLFVSVPGGSVATWCLDEL